MNEKKEEILEEYLKKQFKLQYKTCEELLEKDVKPDFDVLVDGEGWYWCWELEKNLLVGFLQDSRRRKTWKKFIAEDCVFRDELTGKLCSGRLWSLGEHEKEEEKK